MFFGQPSDPQCMEGMDIQHKLDAVAALTLGKDMTWRDYVQGAYHTLYVHEK